MEELLQRYLDNELRGSELNDFNVRLASDPEFALQLQEYLDTLDALEKYGEKTILQKKLDLIHRQIDEEKALKEVLRQKPKYTILRYATFTLVAAGLALLVVMSVLFKMGAFDYNKKFDEYSELKNDINKISSKQQSIWNAFTKSEDKKITRYSGTCFAIAPNGYLATSYHLVKNVDSVVISQYSDSLIKYKARIVYKEPSHDIALLKVDDTLFSGFNTIPYIFANSDAKLGNYVFTLGFSKRDVVFGEGSISSLTGFNGDSSSYQVSIPANPGNSGGPLFDDYGYIIGIISGKNAQREETTYAIKSDFIKTLIDSANTDTLIVDKPQMPGSNQIKWYKRSDKIQKILPLIFRVEAY